MARATCLLVLLALASCADKKPDQRLLSQYLEAKLLYSQGNLAEAEKILKPLAEQSQGFFQAKLLMGKVLFFSNQADEAGRIFSRLLEDYAEYREAGIWYIRSLVIQQRFDQAEALLKDYLQFDARDPRLLFLMGSLYDRKQDPAQAIDFYRQSLLHSGDTGKTHLTLGSLYSRLGIFDKALSQVLLAQKFFDRDSALFETARQLEQMLLENTENQGGNQ